MSSYSVRESGKPSIYDYARVNAQKREPKYRIFHGVRNAAEGVDDSRAHSKSLPEQAAYAARYASTSNFGPYNNPSNLKGGRTRKTKRSHKRKTHRRRR